MRLDLALLGALTLLLGQGAFAHPGGLNAEGCHNDRKRGGYHCHGNRRAETPPVARSSRQVQLLTTAGNYYANCAAARAAGVAPLRRGEPGYRAGLDRDQDGVACE
jgi:hypothetical protein